MAFVSLSCFIPIITGTPEFCQNILFGKPLPRLQVETDLVSGSCWPPQNGVQRNQLATDGAVFQKSLRSRNFN